jgi:RimJ/RimL family protein N-acetyltransferase
LSFEVRAVYGETARVTQFVAEQPPFDRTRDFGECEAIGFEIDGRLVAGVVFSNWSPEAQTIEISAAATDPRWMTRKSLQRIFGYVFSQAGCQLCILSVSEGNRHMRRIALRLGFTEYLIPRLRGRDEAGALYTLTAEQWAASRLKGPDRGQAKTAEAA